MTSNRAHDVAVIGAGPAGCGSTLAHARMGARVLLLEANPRAADRLAGEWLHPGAVEALDELGIDLRSAREFESGRGFVVFPEDGSAPIRLDYEAGARGWSGEHRALVDRLRNAAIAHPNVTYLEGSRVTHIDGQELSIRSAPRETARFCSDRIVGADGRSSRTRLALGLESATTTLSRMAGLRLSGAELPFEGYGHIFLGGPGPILCYRIQPDQVRLCIDVPRSLAIDSATLWDAYAPLLPDVLCESFRRELRAGAIVWAANQVRARTSYGRPGLCLIGDAVGFRHPLTAAGITLGLQDGIELARSDGFEAWQRARRRDTRVAEMLGSVLYEVFADDTESTAAMRQGIYGLWRSQPRERIRTMRYIAARPDQFSAFARTFARVTLPALARHMGGALAAGEYRRAGTLARELAARARWIASGSAPDASAEAALGRDAPSPSPPSPRSPASPRTRTRSPSAADAIHAAVARLALLQREPGVRPGTIDHAPRDRDGWEGEVVWCPMLAAQYVIFTHVMGIELAPERRDGLIRYFERTRTSEGLWGLHSLSEPYLFVTTLVYVASRLLGIDADSRRLAPAGAFIRNQDVTGIPSWGKFWLALAGLYDWRGVPPVIPEVWALPERLPVHPSKFYCHTRQIYLAMSVLYARKPRPARTPLLDRIRDEIFDGRFGSVDWTVARRSLRSAELVTPPGRALRLFYEAAALYDRKPSRALRARLLSELEERIRWELRTTDHTSISPVSGLLNILALASGDAHDSELKRAVEQLEMWIWEDAGGGTRIAGARSASWDTAFVLQAISAAAPHCAAAAARQATEAVERGAGFLRRQQIRSDGVGYRAAYRLDPDGGWCFANAWHGWPVSDCTAEAMEALLATSGDAADVELHRRAIGFVLRCQNPDGGFGSYEARRSKVGLEWLNPAEMFGDSMTEHSYVECTGSCIAALSHATRRFPQLANDATDSALDRAVARLRALQRPDGAWRGVWAVHFVYGTLFGVRGLVAAGVPPSDPALRRARRWLVERQRPDGGWGESPVGCVRGEYIENARSQVVHTAWALLALLEAGESDWRCIDRASEFLIDRQQPGGGWPREDPAGLFFRTALLDYELYRQIFPLWALAAVETRRLERLG